jgi:hypothetical protein
MFSGGAGIESTDAGVFGQHVGAVLALITLGLLLSGVMNGGKLATIKVLFAMLTFLCVDAAAEPDYFNWSRLSGLSFRCRRKAGERGGGVQDHRCGSVELSCTRTGAWKRATRGIQAKGTDPPRGGNGRSVGYQ